MSETRRKQNWRWRNLRNALLICALVLLPALLAHGQPLQAQTGSRLFPETGKTVRGPFLQYWETHGGLMQQGYPVSEEMQERSDTDGNIYAVQYFERAVFELHPELPAGKNVLLSLLGSFEYKRKYSSGAPNQKASVVNPVRFSETGKTLGGRFREYWEKNGGLAQQGFPISEEFEEKSELDGKLYTVQYFERAVMEMHPENRPPHDVLLSQLGMFSHNARYTPRQPLPPTFMQSEGVLYIQVEYYQAQGVSLWKASRRGGGPFQELTTIHEWWIDAQNPYRYVSAVTEMLENGPQLINASGANGVDTWWELNEVLKIPAPAYHQGLERFGEEWTFASRIGIFSHPGERLVGQVRSGEAQQVGEEERSPWGKVLLIRRTDAQSGVVGNYVVRAEEPHVRVDWGSVDKDGKKIQSYRLTHWEWYDTQQVDDRFWMRPPTLDAGDRR